MKKRLDAGLFRAVEGRKHSLECHHSIALFEKSPDQAPIECTIRPDADPATLAVRRRKEPLATKQEVNIRGMSTRSPFFIHRFRDRRAASSDRAGPEESH